MNQKLLAFICLICLSCSGVNTQIAANTGHDWIPCGYGMEFCSKFENDFPNRCEEATIINTTSVKINSRIYIFVSSYCVAKIGSFKETCPYGHSNKSLSFTYNEAEDIQAHLLMGHRLSFVGYHEDDFGNLRQFCNNELESRYYQMCGHDVSQLKSVCNAWIWVYNSEGKKERGLINPINVRQGEITTLPPAENTGIVLVFKED